ALPSTATSSFRPIPISAEESSSRREQCARFSSSGDLGGAAPAARASAKARASASGGGAPRAVKNVRDSHRLATWAEQRLRPERARRRERARAGVGPPASREKCALSACHLQQLRQHDRRVEVLARDL